MGKEENGMLSLDVRISPVYSAYHPTARLNGMRLLQHQVETLEAFRDPEIDVVINTAMTGDGKSLAAYLSIFQGQEDLHVIAMYPTNELIRDQLYALERYQRDLQLRLSRYDMMYSERITRLMRDHGEAKRLEEVRKLLVRNGILLTNPDLVHLIMSYQYGWDFQRKELPIAAGVNFDYFLFDEFHVFGVPQVVAVANMLGYLHALYGHKQQERKKYLFLSATPTPLLTRLLERSSLRHAVITGHYTSTAQRDESRCILQLCDISLHAISQDQTSEAWIEGHKEDLLHFFQRYPSSKAAILVYSPATARRLAQRLEASFAPHGITVGENTGLTTAEDRAEALRKHILVGTSTVDVGIDFHINYLIFEAYSAGSFLQRFGRLGRHAEFETYRAYSLVPRFVLERISADLAGNSEIDRERFNAAVYDAFPIEQEFSRYSALWGSVQAVHIVESLEAQGAPRQDENAAFRKALVEQYERMYGTPEKPAMESAGKKYRMYHHKSQEVLRDLLSFRGQSPLECGVWDMTDLQKHSTGTLLTYDLFFLLANTKFEVIEKIDFLHEVQQRQLEELDFRDKLLYLKIHEYIPERSRLLLEINYKLATADAGEQRLHRLLVLNGLIVREPRCNWLDCINAALKQLKLTCVISSVRPPQELRRQLKLGAVFPLYSLRDKLDCEYSITFGQEALLLDSLLRFRPASGGTYMMA
jgi:CRISPR-associated endonuclease/helicase Cas3